MPENPRNNLDHARLTDLMERLGAIGLYLVTDMDHHAIARKTGHGNPTCHSNFERIEEI